MKIIDISTPDEPSQVLANASGFDIMNGRLKEKIVGVFDTLEGTGFVRPI